MQSFLEHFPIATVVALIVLIVGGVAVITDDISFDDYMQSAAVLIGLLGIGRGAAALTRVKRP